MIFFKIFLSFYYWVLIVSRLTNRVSTSECVVFIVETSKYNDRFQRAIRGYELACKDYFVRTAASRLGIRVVISDIKAPQFDSKFFKLVAVSHDVSFGEERDFFYEYLIAANFVFLVYKLAQRLNPSERQYAELCSPEVAATEFLLSQNIPGLVVND